MCSNISWKISERKRRIKIGYNAQQRKTQKKIYTGIFCIFTYRKYKKDPNEKSQIFNKQLSIYSRKNFLALPRYFFNGLQMY